MFCTKCGKQLPEGARFCVGCGAAVVTASPAAEYTEPACQQKNAPVEVLEQEAGVSPGEAAAWEAQAETAPEVPEYFPPEAEKPKKRSWKARLILLTVVALAVLALAVSLISVIRAAATPEAKLLRAARKSGQELTELMNSSGNFKAMMTNLAGLLEEEEYTVKLHSASAVSYGEDFSTEAGMELVLSSSRKERELQGSLEVSSSYSYSKYNRGDMTLTADFYANEEELILALPGAVEGSYSLPTEDLGEKLFDSALGDLLRERIDRKTRKALECLDPDLFARPQWEDFQEACPAEAKAFTRSILLEKSEERIILAEGEPEVYSLSFDLEAFAVMASAYQVYAAELSYGEDMADHIDSLEDSARQLQEAVEGVEFVAYFGLQDGLLTAIHVEIWDEEDEQRSFTLLLEGRDNIWEDFVLFGDKEELFHGGFEQTEDGFELYLEAGEELVIICDDPACELLFRLDGEELTLDFAGEEGGCQIYFDSSDSYGVMGDEGSTGSFAFEILPMEPIEKPEEATELLEMEEEELAELLEEIEAAFE